MADRIMAAVVVVMALFLVSMARADNSDICNTCVNGCEDKCNRNCSYSEVRFKNDDDPYFSCHIGYLREVTQFRTDHKDWIHHQVFDPPNITFVELYLPEGHPALRIQFLLPKGVTSGPEYKYARAIFLKFQSIEDKLFQDEFFYNCPRERIFNFWYYDPKSNYDAAHPRKITFDCFYGLNISESMRVYLITLQAAEGRNITYTVTAHVHRTSPQLSTTKLADDFKSTIITHFNESSRSVYTVFEEPSTFKALLYRVKLYKIDHGVTEDFRMIPGDHILTFHNLTKGSYYVQVVVLMGKKNFTSTSYVIDASMLPESADSRLHYLEKKQTMQMILVGVGVLLGCLLVMVLIYVMRQKIRPKFGKKQSHTDPSLVGIVLHPFSQADKNWKQVMEKFEVFLKNVCNVTLLPNRMPRDGDCDPQEWCQNLIQQASFVIVLYNNVCFKPDEPCTVNHYYSYMLERAVDKKNKGNNLRILPVSFSIQQCHKPGIISEIHGFNLMQEMQKLYCRLHGVVPEHVPTAILDSNGTEWQALQGALAACSRPRVHRLENNRPVTPDSKNRPPTTHSDLESGVRKGDPFEGLRKINEEDLDEPEEMPLLQKKGDVALDKLSNTFPETDTIIAAKKNNNKPNGILHKKQEHETHVGNNSRIRNVRVRIMDPNGDAGQPLEPGVIDHVRSNSMIDMEPRQTFDDSGIPKQYHADVHHPVLHSLPTTNTQSTYQMSEPRSLPMSSNPNVNMYRDGYVPKGMNEAYTSTSEGSYMPSDPSRYHPHGFSDRPMYDDEHTPMLQHQEQDSLNFMQQTPTQHTDRLRFCGHNNSRENPCVHQSILKNNPEHTCIYPSMDASTSVHLHHSNGMHQCGHECCSDAFHSGESFVSGTHELGPASNVDNRLPQQGYPASLSPLPRGHIPSSYYYNPKPGQTRKGKLPPLKDDKDLTQSPYHSNPPFINHQHNPHQISMYPNNLPFEHNLDRDDWNEIQGEERADYFALGRQYSCPNNDEMSSRYGVNLNLEQGGNSTHYTTNGARNMMTGVETLRLGDSPRANGMTSEYNMDRTAVPVNGAYDPTDNSGGQTCHQAGNSRVNGRTDTYGPTQDENRNVVPIRFEAIDCTDMLARGSSNSARDEAPAGVGPRASVHSLPADLTDYDSYNPAPPTDDSSVEGSIQDVMQGLKQIEINYNKSKTDDPQC